MNSNKVKHMKILISSFYIILIDQISKYLILAILSHNNSIDIIPNFLRITLAINRGAAFSLFSNSTNLLTIISILTSAILITIILKFPPRSYWNLTGLSFLLGGTLGNGIDRLFRGYVIDFLELIPFDFPIFNIADISINIAIICFILDITKTKPQSKHFKHK